MRGDSESGEPTLGWISVAAGTAFPIVADEGIAEARPTEGEHRPITLNGGGLVGLFTSHLGGNLSERVKEIARGRDVTANAHEG